MTKQDRELLLIDLSGRLPFHPIIYGKRNYTFNEGPLGSVNTSGIRFMTGGGTVCDYYLEEVKPYLRPLSDMTEEEDNERKQLGILCAIKGNGSRERIFDGFGNESVDTQLKALDWLHKHHFDYRGLIEKGLALRAPKGMYKMN